MEETAVLIERSQAGDKGARETLIEENLGLVRHIVKRFAGRGYDMEDLFQIGCIGLMKAIDKFDLSYEVRFSTYAVPMIQGEIKRFLRDDGMVKVSRTLKENGWKIKKAAERLSQKLGREATLKELSEATGLTPEEIARTDLATDAPESLQQETADGLTLEGALGTEAPEEGLVERIALREAIDRLPEKERMTILLRYFKGLTQEQTARVVGVSQVQISRLERRGLKRLRETFEE